MIGSLFDDYGAGTHSWYYWERDLTQSLPRIEAAFAHPPVAPRRVQYTTIDPTFSDYGWEVAITRADREFATLSAASAAGFTLAGSGSGKVTTPGFYRPGSTVQALIRSGSGTTEVSSVADKAGQVTVTVPLGPSNTVDEYSPQAKAMDLAYRAQEFGAKAVVGSPGTVVYTATGELTGPRPR